ncbi:larval/pupal cuticle protein H1C [Pararge aegeria]|uniref:larval/pupal cuticle protein H1C n=1 Tax=Pararge aegeria TaxID=116150 RepID=UPI0019D05F1C|nr:larval/pupal cuticle protein H1C [Pararge aegeria]
MYKLVVLAALLAYASAGLISPIASPWGNAGAWGHGLVGAPAVVSAPIVSAPIVKQAVPVATSYANTVRIAAPAVAVAAPAPLAYAAHGPVVSSYGHGW